MKIILCLIVILVITASVVAENLNGKYFPFINGGQQWISNGLAIADDYFMLSVSDGGLICTAETLCLYENRLNNELLICLRCDKKHICSTQFCIGLISPIECAKG